MTESGYQTGNFFYIFDLGNAMSLSPVFKSMGQTEFDKTDEFFNKLLIRFNQDPSRHEKSVQNQLIDLCVNPLDSTNVEPYKYPYQ